LFSSLMKQNKKAKICFVICFAGKKKLLFYIYAVIVKQEIYKRSSNYYLYIIACLRQVVAFAPKVIIACLRQGFCIRKTR
jgi:hypothetical protein